MTSSPAKSAAIVHFLYEPGDGGLDRVAILLANGMARRGIETELWLTRANGSVADMIAPNVTVRIVPTPKLGGRGTQLLLQIPAVARMIRKHRPKAIFSAGNQTNLSVAIARELAGSDQTTFIQKITNPILRPGLSRWAKISRTWRFGFTARFADLCLTLSDADAEHYAKIYPHAAGKFHCVPNPYVTDDMLDLGEHRQVRTQKAPAKLLAVGRITAQKDYPTLISALALIADHPWSMTILGDGSMREEMKQRAKALGIADRIKFKGFISDPTPYYAQSDILVLSSQWEGLPAVPLEAMATGCAIVATDCSEGLTRLLRQAGHDTVPVQNAQALATAIAEAIDTPQAIAPLKACAHGFSIEASVDRHIERLEQSLASI
ncbi:glycosyltransferase [Parasphingorhabdus sp.]|uniref:glycosyltransferase n=1 Tax=Parasphingorhabdus sp. TaxID=2709688 RepID=UPI0030026035